MTTRWCTLLRILPIGRTLTSATYTSGRVREQPYPRDIATNWGYFIYYSHIIYLYLFLGIMSCILLRVIPLLSQLHLSQTSAPILPTYANIQMCHVLTLHSAAHTTPNQPAPKSSRREGACSSRRPKQPQ